MKIISMKQLRERFGPIKKGLRRGKEYLLLYRSQPLAHIKPYEKKDQAKQDKVKELPPVQTISAKKNPTNIKQEAGQNKNVNFGQPKKKLSQSTAIAQALIAKSEQVTTSTKTKKSQRQEYSKKIKSLLAP